MEEFIPILELETDGESTTWLLKASELGSMITREILLQ